MRRRQQAMLAAGLLVAPFMLLDLMLPSSTRVALAGAGWTAALLVGAALQSTASPGWRGLGTAVASLGGVASLVVKVAATGFAASVFFPLFLALPLIVMAVAPELPLLVAATSLACLVAGTALRLVDPAGLGGGDVLYWVVLSSSVMGLGVVGSALVQRQLRRELAAERARVEALEALTESERRRAEVERYAEVGRLAAAVSHEMNNPLASVAANLRWLTGPEATDAVEQHQVVVETLEGVDRLSAVLKEIRKVSLAADADEVASHRRPAPPGEPTS